jgi:phosphoribosylanthranilate isomerase
MTWVKICGITNLEDALTAVDADADAVGFVFYEKSPRRIDAEMARSIVAGLPAHIEKVGVFVNRSAEEVADTATRVGITAAQVYVDVEPAQGDAECAYCFEQLTKKGPQIKLVPVLSMRRERPEGRAMMWDPDAVYAFLLDSGSGGGQPGGTGRQFDWAGNGAAITAIKSLARVIVAGGLTAGNVVEAIEILKPWGVDVSSGVEAQPGKKDPGKVRAFIAAVREAEEKP